MDTADDDSTGCEEAVSRSDDRVRKMTEQPRGPSLSNQIHIANRGFKGSRGNQSQVINLACNDGLITSPSFPQLQESRSGKRRNNPFLPFTFQMRTSIVLCQTE
jgi:hypothetical protein